MPVGSDPGYDAFAQGLGGGLGSLLGGYIGGKINQKREIKSQLESLEKQSAFRRLQSFAEDPSVNVKNYSVLSAYDPEQKRVTWDVTYTPIGEKGTMKGMGEVLYANTHLPVRTNLTDYKFHPFVSDDRKKERLAPQASSDKNAAIARWKQYAVNFPSKNPEVKIAVQRYMQKAGPAGPTHWNTTKLQSTLRLLENIANAEGEDHSDRILQTLRNRADTITLEVERSQASDYAVPAGDLAELLGIVSQYYGSRMQRPDIFNRAETDISSRIVNRREGSGDLPHSATIINQ